MGSFISIIGDSKISDDNKLQQYVEEAKKVLDIGGMMNIDSIKMFGKELNVYTQPEENEEGRIIFLCNYFEDDAWEWAGINVKDGDTYSNKVGSFQFASVMSALYVLLEQYTDEYCFTNDDGDLCYGRYELAWLNKVLKKTWKEKERFEPWKLYELLHHEGMEYLASDFRGFDNLVDESRMMDYISTWYCYDPVDFMDRLDEWADETGEERLKMHRACIRVIELSVDELILRNGKDEDVYNEIIENIIDRYTPSDKKDKELEPSCKEINSIARMADYYSPQIAVKIVSEKYNKDFWEVWDGVKEKAKDIGNNECIFLTDKYYTLPIASYLAVEDDDRIYWWRENDNTVSLSEKMQGWLNQLGCEYREILQSDSKLISKYSSVKSQIELMKKANDTYWRIVPLKSQVEEFIERAGEPEYSAAMVLFDDLIERYKEEGAVINEIKGSWYTASYKLKENKGRMKIKRYIALLANKELRMKVLGF